MLINCSGYNFRPSASDVPVSDAVKKRFGKSDVDGVFGTFERIIFGTYTGNGKTQNDKGKDAPDTWQTIVVGVKPIAVITAHREQGFRSYSNSTFQNVLYGGLALPDVHNKGIELLDNGFKVLQSQDSDFGYATALNMIDSQYNYIVWY